MAKYLASRVLLECCDARDNWKDSHGRIRCVLCDVPSDPKDNWRHAMAEREAERGAIQRNNKESSDA